VTEPARHLRLVDPAGELQGTTCPDCLVKDQEKTRMYRSLDAQIKNLKAELEAEQGSEPEAGDIRAVLTYWCLKMVDTGWYTRQPKFKPGDERWKAVRRRLREGYSVAYMRTVTDSIAFADTQRVRRAWLEPKTLFGGHMESRYEDVVAKCSGPVWVPSKAWLFQELFKQGEVPRVG
jgi:uncharacterized phage protein (TIGR02220 family)